MHKHSEQTYKSPFLTQNADIQYLLDLFNNQQLSLTITEDTQQNQRSSTIYNRQSSESIDIRQEISDAKYRFSFLNFFKKHRSEAISFIDAAIRFMNSIKKYKIQEVLSNLAKEDVLTTVMEHLVSAEMLVDPIKEQLMYRQLSEKDVSRYEQILSLLQQAQTIKADTKTKILQLLSEIQSA